MTTVAKLATIVALLLPTTFGLICAAVACAHWLDSLDRGEPGAVVLAVGLVLLGAVLVVRGDRRAA